MNDRFGDDFYKPNEGGFYEIDPKEYGELDFPRPYDGKLIKVIWNGLSSMCPMPGGIRIVLMTRDPEAIRQTREAFFGQAPPLVEDYWHRVSTVRARMLNRRDVLSVDTFSYETVLDEPLRAFERLARRGWPIDPVAAAAEVRPERCRFRKEVLTIGI